MASIQANILMKVFRLMRVWRSFVSEEAVLRNIRNLRTQSVAQPTSKMRRRFAINQRLVDGHNVVSMIPKASKPGRVLYIHGGGYFQEAIGVHWSFAGKLADTLALETVVPQYPLAPEHNVDTVMSFMLTVYRRLVQDDPKIPLIVIGDSAGGGLALALIQEAKRLALPAAAGVILISPWLDGTMSSPGQEQLELLDPFCRRAGLLAAAKMYAGKRQLDHPWVSPLYGHLSDLPPILMFGGDHDILVTDSRRLVDLARKQNVPLEYDELAKLFHVWPLLPLPESRIAHAKIARFVAQCLGQTRQ